MTTQTAQDLYVDKDFESRLADEVARAIEVRRPYAVLAVLPQHFADEDVSPDIEVAADIVADLMRDEDLGGRLDGEMIVVGLRDTDLTGARSFASRLQGDLSLRLQAHNRTTIWEAGLAILPDNGMTADELIGAAIHSARTHRRRLGML